MKTREWIEVVKTYCDVCKTECTSYQTWRIEDEEYHACIGSVPLAGRLCREVMQERLQRKGTPG